jgi:hypothetical protein
MKRIIGLSVLLLSLTAAADEAPSLEIPHAPIVRQLGTAFFGAAAEAKGGVELEGKTATGAACTINSRWTKYGFYVRAATGDWAKDAKTFMAIESGVTNSHYTTSGLVFTQAPGKFVIDRVGVSGINERGEDIAKEHLEITFGAPGADKLLKIKSVKLTSQMSDLDGTLDKDSTQDSIECTVL